MLLCTLDGEGDIMRLGESRLEIGALDVLRIEFDDGEDTAEKSLF